MPKSGNLGAHYVYLVLEGFHLHQILSVFEEAHEEATVKTYQVKVWCFFLVILRLRKDSINEDEMFGFNGFRPFLLVSVYVFVQTMSKLCSCIVSKRDFFGCKR